MARSNPSRRGQTQAAFSAIVGVVAVVAFAAAIVFSRPGAAAPSPSAPPSAVPSPAAPSAPASPATPKPSPSDAAVDPSKVRLDIADKHDVIVAIQDPDKVISSAKSGRAADGMSIRWHDVDVQNVDDRTLRITWAGLPLDEQIDLAVASRGDGLSLSFVQAGPYANTDAMGADRVLIVSFDRPIDASKVVTKVLDRTVD